MPPKERAESDMSRYFIAGGGCYGSYYVRQLDRARQKEKLKVDEIVVVDKDASCAVAKELGKVEGARLVVSDWLDFGVQAWANRVRWRNDMWVPTPIGPHILFHWLMRQTLPISGKTWRQVPYQGPIPSLPYAKVIGQGTLVLSHAPGLCPVNCIEPMLCPLTKDTRGWEMKDTVSNLIASDRDKHCVDDVGIFVCHHHSHGVGTIPMSNIYGEWERMNQALGSGARRVAVATVSSCHGILDVLEAA